MAWTAEQWRTKRAKQRAAEIAAGTRVRKIERRHKCDLEEIPEEVYERGKVLRAMMLTMPDQWKPEWTADL